MAPLVVRIGQGVPSCQQHQLLSYSPLCGVSGNVKQVSKEEVLVGFILACAPSCSVWVSPPPPPPVFFSMIFPR